MEYMNILQNNIWEEEDSVKYLKQWNMIVDRLTGNCIEIPTVPKVKKDPVWFSATTDGVTIFINEAVNNKPSSKLSMQRKL